MHNVSTLTTSSSIAEVYLGIITACLPVLPAFWKHHFGADESTGYGYSRYDDQTSQSLDNMSARRPGKRSTMPSHKVTPDYGSDENVLIEEMIMPRNYGSRAGYNETTVSGTRLDSDVPPTPTYPGAVKVTTTVDVRKDYQ
jgi:hypothetical protein